MAGSTSLSSRSHSVARDVIVSVLVGIAYFGSAKLGFLLASATRQVTAVWPPTGIAIVAMLLYGKRVWPAVWIAAFVVNVNNSETWITAFGIAIGNTAGTALGAYLLRRTHFDARLERIRDVLALVGLGAVCAMAVTALNGVACLALSGVVPWSNYFSVLWVWWVGDAMGVLIIAPLLLTWLTQPESPVPWTRRRVLEYAALLGTLSIASRLLFFHAFPLTYAVFPFAVWAALRFGQRETTLVILVIVMAAVWGLIHDLGPFSRAAGDQRLIFLVLFMGVMAITVLVLGAATSERAHADRALHQAHYELEHRVAERTGELASANDHLKHANRELARRSDELAAKNSEVESFVYVVSHDLRAPLVNLHGFSAELRASCAELEASLASANLSDSDRQELRRLLLDNIPESLRFITNSTSKLQRLIDALLVLSRTGREQYSPEVLDLNLLVRATVEVLKPSIAKSGAAVELGTLPQVYGDQTAVGQVFSNLIGNAINYLRKDTPGMITVGGEIQDDMCHFWVRDNGCGIGTNAQRRLFQVFQRFHPHMNPGEGMGLAIVKRVVERHGGRVWAESVEGTGSTFHFTLPAAGNRSMTAWPRPA